MASYTQIIEEIPSGTINSVNKVFTIVNTPVTNGLSLYYNGVAQTSGVDYSLVGTTITFVSAPTTGSIIMAKVIVSIEVTATSDNLLTLGQILTKIYGKMGIKSDSTIFNITNIVTPKLNSIISQICNGLVTNIFDNNKNYKSGFLRFLAKKYFFKTKTPVKLTASTTGGTIEFDTTNFDSAGSIIINEDIITYTGKTSTSITGYSGLSYNHDEGSVVEQVFELPSTAGKNFNVWDLSNKTKPITYVDDRAPKTFIPYWTLKYDSSSNKEFIYIKGVDNRNICFDYYAKSVDMSADTDTSILPDKLMEDIAIPLTAGILLYSTYRDDTLGKKGEGLAQEGYTNLQALYGHNAERVKEFRKIVKRPNWGHTRTYIDNDIE